VATNLRGRFDEAVEADRIVSEEVERLEGWLRSRQAVPLIVSLQNQFEQIRAGEMERMRGKLGSLTPQQLEAVDALARGIINKIAHGPIAELRKNAGNSDGMAVAEVIRRAFRLDD
jgi:glutamyl-tRNA reductase